MNTISHPVNPGFDSVTMMGLKANIAQLDLKQTIGPFTVDDQDWYQIRVGIEVSEWIRLQPSDQWWEHPGDWRWFDIDARLLTILILKYS